MWLALAANNILEDGQNHEVDYQTTSAQIQNLTLFVSSWNVGGIAPPSELNMEDLLHDENNLADIYVLGFQEIVPLNAGNILVQENTSISMQWNSLIRTALNKTDDIRLHHKAELGESHQKVYPLKREGSFTSNSPHFECIISKQMVGIFITIWARSPLLPYIRHTSVSSVGCGIFGCLGNKSFGFWWKKKETRESEMQMPLKYYHAHNFPLIHFNVCRERFYNTTRVFDLSIISPGYEYGFASSGNIACLSRCLNYSSSRVIWLGDLNYRICLPEPTTRSLVNDRQWSTLLQNDQLKAELREGCTFEGWNEEEIEFAPTYKYNLDSDDYYGCNNQKGEEGKRIEPLPGVIGLYGLGRD